MPMRPDRAREIPEPLKGLRDTSAVIGIGETEYRKRGGFSDRTEFDLCCEAIERAAEDAGISVHEIDGFASYATERQEPIMLQLALGIPELHFSNMVWGAGAGGCSAAVMNAAMAVTLGLAKYVVVYRSISQGQFQRFGQFQRRAMHQNFTSPFGQSPPIHGMAMVARRHMHLYGTTEEQFGAVSVTARNYSHSNPRALFQSKPMTLEDHHASRMIASPLRLFDNCLETDGAAAIIVTSAERAKDAKGSPVLLRGFGHGSGPRWATGSSGSHNMPPDDYTTVNATLVAQQLWESAGLGPDEIDVAQLYDAFTPIPILQLEDYGFVGRGEGGPFIEAGETGPDGRLPSNTSGGQLSEGYLQGMNLVLEGVRQMRGESTSNIAGAETCLVASGGALGHKSALVLRKY